MSLATFVTILTIGLVGSFISGMLGIGGSIVKYPLLLYIPPLLGVAAFTAHQVSGISAVQVLFAAGSGVWAYRKGNFLHWKLISYMGSAILIGSFIGAFGAKFLPESTINIIYASLATVAAIMMFFSNKELEEIPVTEITFQRSIAVIASFIVGILCGIVGAAGAFILVPIMLVVLRIPTRVTIASSLAITLISSIGTTIGKLSTGDVLLGPALIMIWASILGAPLGARISKHMNTRWLRFILAALILATSLKIWMDVLL
ncbi:sulfite exporter TauE/SafE family protein [Alicyclobacillus tolerans]|uniref:Probable membrane transporter protein n=2 Tax=Alicyclobacillus tolerans TaxID=90970 RepID=A0ABT9LV09_9BACL|nr:MULTISPECIES: sulfite exporter TauE/SafE family protein [Alicyclobacillus]MDP9728114.1 putative membrane protein YfcA [Alicyclobacillus tengchongensis]QRF23342.1 sulfite exporter TauE/SafE family protein [Alicyclobacillus sp. TC]SHJ86369.1 hypothetical protein SAMN05443507_104168 [Alicyclobacillus montanus]